MSESTFMDEVKNFKSDIPAQAAVETAQLESASEPVAHEFDMGLPVGSKAVDQSVADKAVREPDVADERPKIKIGAKEFTTFEEAHRYAEELEIARVQQEGVIEGYKMAQQSKPEEKVEAEIPKSLAKQVEALLFEDPEKAIQMLSEGLKKELESNLDTKTKLEREEREAQATRKQVWNDFYSENTDLAESKDYVDFVLEKNPDLLQMTTEKALEKLAELSRKGLRITKQAALPRKELQAGPAITAAAGGQATGTKAQSTEEPEVDFVTALKQIRKLK